jgi:hypothetical protein
MAFATKKGVVAFVGSICVRPFIISALAATLIGCTWVAPKQTQQAPLMGYGAASSLNSATVAKTKRTIAAKKRRHHRKPTNRTKSTKANTLPTVSSSTQPNDKSDTLANTKSTAKTESTQSSQPASTSNTSINSNSPAAAKKETAQSPQPADTSNLSANPNAATIAKTEIPQSSQRDDKVDAVIKKAMPIIAAKMNSASVELIEMKRAEKNAAGKSIDTICGYVRGKNASGAQTAERPFLYLVQENEAYVGGYNMAISPYHNLCHQ